MSVKEVIERANLASITAVFVVIGGLYYAIVTSNSELASFIVGAGVTWLFDQRNG